MATKKTTKKTTKKVVKETEPSSVDISGTSDVTFDASAVAFTVPETDTAPPVEKEESNKVEVDADVLKNIMDQLNTLQKAQGEFEKTASQDQIQKIERLRASGKLVKAVKLRRIEGKLVLAWKMILDEVYYADGKVHERQEYEVIFDDGTKKEMAIREFTRKSVFESYEVIKEARLADGGIEYTLQMPDGKELIIKETYIN